jgi:hypothetical protein
MQLLSIFLSHSVHPSESCSSSNITHQPSQSLPFTGFLSLYHTWGLHLRLKQERPLIGVKTKAFPSGQRVHGTNMLCLPEACTFSYSPCSWVHKNPLLSNNHAVFFTVFRPFTLSHPTTSQVHPNTQGQESATCTWGVHPRSHSPSSCGARRECGRGAASVQSQLSQLVIWVILILPLGPSVMLRSFCTSLTESSSVHGLPWVISI